MKKSILNLGKTLSNSEQKTIKGSYDASAYPNCGTHHCDEQKGFFCEHGICQFYGDYD